MSTLINAIALVACIVGPILIIVTAFYCTLARRDRTAQEHWDREFAMKQEFARNSLSDARAKELEAETRKIDREIALIEAQKVVHPSWLKD